jgi:histidinol-phosphatase
VSDNLNTRLEFAERIAVEAGRSTLGLFHAPARHADTKPDGSPVTAADRNAETLLRKRIGETYPDDAILGEEFDDKPGTSGWQWILDPIDGTKSFVHGVPLYGTMVACEFEGQPRVGVIHMPALDETIAGAVSEQGTRKGWWKPAGLDERRPLAVTPTPTLKQAMALWTCPEVYRDLGVLHVFQHLEHVLGHQRGWSDCYGYVLLTTGRADAVIEAGLQIWDIAAALPILHAAGARVSDWTGGEDFGSGRVVASNGPVHDDFLREIQRALAAD